ncbi:MAG: TIGR02281 family clan AA aspartic protease [Rubrivivax sp.]|nr:TIGR02281 family clan AA aspartic protease [Rubrivivax sp.]
MNSVGLHRARPWTGRRARRYLWAAAVVALAAGAPAVPAQAPASDVALGGRMGDKALLMVQGRTVVLGVGQSEGHSRVRLLRWDGDAAVVEQDGVQLRLRVGQAPLRMGASASGVAAGGGREIVIPAGPGGHFLTAGSINGQAVRFMVDTGATLIALPRTEAARLGLDLRGARSVVTQTANGPVTAQMLPLQRVRVGDVEVYNVMAVVTEAPMPFILLGNSYLERFQWRRDNDVMRLEKR